MSDQIENQEIDHKDDENVIKHYGTPRHSGRYPWGSGKNPQRNKNFLQRADELKAQKMSDKEIAEVFGMSTGQYRNARKVYKYEKQMDDQLQAYKLREKGWSNVAIAEKLGVSEGTVRNMLDPNKKKQENRITTIANELENKLKERPYLDVGEGVNRQLGVSEEYMNAVLMTLEDRGYQVLPYRLPQATNPKQFTNMRILCKDDVTREEISENLEKVTSPEGLYFENNGDIVRHNKPIPSIDSKRIAVKYAEEGGADKDGVIEIRPGVEDLSLGGRNYAQVRIGVDGTHYLKGMAVYGYDMPPGVDIVFNTSKHEGTPILGKGDSTVLKQMKDDAQNPFGAAFRQWDYPDADGNMHTSPINIVNDDEDWEGWKKNLSSQFLSKQPVALAKRQLDLKYSEMADEFNELKNLNNPTIKRELLEEFSDNCDSAAEHLKAAALPRQGSFAILPVNSLKDNEVFAPRYENGEEVILVRHPHAGTFEIPRLKVNNKNQEALEVIGNEAAHAIGINSTVAKQLSGADYDGDTVLVIPTKGQNITTDRPLKGLQEFTETFGDTYARDPELKRCTGKSRDGMTGDGFNKGMQMGMVSNLITDMTIKGATLPEIERAVKHSMVVIDAEKHNLDWQRSEIDQGIADLREKYQNGGGASTLISKAKGQHAPILERKEYYSKNDSRMTDEERERFENGERVYYNSGRKYPEKNKKTGEYTGKWLDATETISNMAFEKDARNLSTGTYMEEVYAAHANRMKALANEARKEMRATGNLKRNKNAEKAYAEELASINEKYLKAELEAPKERQAQAIARSNINARIAADPTLKDKDNAGKLKKISQKAVNDARDIVNGGEHKKRYRITLTDKEWEAIQAGAISDTRLRKIIQYSDKNEIKKLAMPRENRGLTSTQRSRARLLLDSGHTLSEVAESLGISTSTLTKELKSST